MVILYILLGVVIAIIFNFIRSLIIKKISLKITKSDEKFDFWKFISGFSLFDLKLWAKSITILFRHTIIFGIIFGIIYGVGVYRGRLGKPVTFNMEGKDAYIKLNDHYLHIQKNGEADVVDKDKKTVLKKITVKDIPELRRALRPYGFQIKPIGIIGYGFGKDKNKIEFGAGLSWLKYFKWRFESFITSKGLYPAAVAYKITNNSGLGLGIGKGYSSDNRIVMYYRWNF